MTSPKFQKTVLLRIEVLPLSQPRRGIELEYIGPMGLMDHFLLAASVNVLASGMVAVGSDDGSTGRGGAIAEGPYLGFVSSSDLCLCLKRGFRKLMLYI